MYYERTMIANNTFTDNGTLMNYADCESTSLPQIDGNVLTNCTFARSSTEKHSGSYSYKLTKTIAAGTGASALFTDNSITTDMHGMLLKQGGYRLSLWVYIPTSGGCLPGEVRVRMNQYYSAAWHTEEVIPTEQDEWEYIEVDITLNAAVTGMLSYIQIESPAANTEFLYVDDIRLTPLGIANEHSQHLEDNGVGTILS